MGKDYGKEKEGKEMVDDLTKKTEGLEQKRRKQHFRDYRGCNVFPLSGSKNRPVTTKK